MRQSLFAFLLSILAQTTFAQPIDTVAQIDKLFSSWSNATPGASVLVARGEKILYHKAFGLANLESNVPNTINTIFEAGSVSKQFTAYSILILENEGKLKLTDDVRKYIPELPVYEAPVTIQQCLNHTSGLKDWGSVGALSGWPRGSRDYTLPLALHIICKQKTTNFKPGNEYSYSNSNYSLLVEIVQRVSKQSLEDFTSERLFKPNGMTSTRWRSDFRDIVPGRAQAYSNTDDGYELNMPFEHIYGHGGLLTTTGDLLKWNQLLEKHDAIHNKRVTRGKLNDGKEISYAAGIQHGGINGVEEIAHSGSTGGYRAWLAYYPSKKITVALLSNDATCPPVYKGRQVAEVFFGAIASDIAMMDTSEPAAIAFNPKLYAGEYYSDEAECTFRIVEKNNSLIVINDALQEAPIQATAPNIFLIDGDKIEFQVTKNKVTGFKISISRANNVPFKKVSR